MNLIPVILTSFVIGACVTFLLMRSATNAARQTANEERELSRRFEKRVISLELQQRYHDPSDWWKSDFRRN